MLTVHTSNNYILWDNLHLKNIQPNNKHILMNCVCLFNKINNSNLCID